MKYILLMAFIGVSLHAMEESTNKQEAAKSCYWLAETGYDIENPDNLDFLVWLIKLKKDNEDIEEKERIIKAKEKEEVMKLYQLFD